MREFFQGWRRKAGCVALMLAASLFVAWMRSRAYVDRLTLRMSPTADVSFYSQHDGIEFEYRWETDGVTDADVSMHFGNLFDWQTSQKPIEDHSHRFPTQDFFVFRIRSEGWKALRSNGMDVSCHGRILCIPHTPAMLIVTLLSAYLILWQPRKRSGP